MKHIVYKFRHKETGLYFQPVIPRRKMTNLSETGKVYVTKPTYVMFKTYIHPDDYLKQSYKTPKRDASGAFEIVAFELVETNE